MSRWIRANQLAVKKTGSYYISHITVAASVAYAVTGDVAASVTLSLLEPSVQAVVYFFHERAWERLARRTKTGGALDDGVPAAA